MMPADYVCNVAVECRTCDVVGKLTNVGTLRVQQIARTHRECDVSVDITAIRKRGRKDRVR